jgi:extracellular factor (EF) 3-hydroxypalmitic acid methyl ester biosynthesis protein
LYAGAANVRHATPTQDALILGFEVLGSVNLAAIYEIAERRQFADEQLLLQNRASASRDFSAWLAALAAYLRDLKLLLDQHDARLAGLDLWSREYARGLLVSEIAPLVIERLNCEREELGQRVAGFSEEEHLTHRALYRAEILQYFAHSPFMKRAFDKPLGYAGDYEMMNMLYRDHAEGASTFGRVLNLYVTQEPAAKANINRIELLGTRIRHAIQRRQGERARVLSVGCGPAHEIAGLLEQSPQLAPLLDVVLIDQEPRVIEFGERSLAPRASRLGARVTFMRESVRNILGAEQLSESLGLYDLVYSAGLFDYLNPKTFRALLGALYQCTVAGGELAVGNVASHNPTRWWMDYALDWQLHHRSREELLELADDLSPKPGEVEVDSEPLGVNLFLAIRK